MAAGLRAFHVERSGLKDTEFGTTLGRDLHEIICMLRQACGCTELLRRSESHHRKSPAGCAWPSYGEAVMGPTGFATGEVEPCTIAGGQMDWDTAGAYPYIRPGV